MASSTDLRLNNKQTGWKELSNNEIYGPPPRGGVWVAAATATSATATVPFAATTGYGVGGLETQNAGVKCVGVG